MDKKATELKYKLDAAYDLYSQAVSNWHNLTNDEQQYFIDILNSAQKEYENYTGFWG